jgi:hypothetical protein
MKLLDPHGEERVFARLRTMLRIAGGTMKARISPVAILRDDRLRRSPQDEGVQCRNGQQPRASEEVGYAFG